MMWKTLYLLDIETLKERALSGEIVEKGLLVRVGSGISQNTQASLIALLDSDWPCCYTKQNIMICSICSM